MADGHERPAVGSLWVDNDPRSKRKRYIRVSEIEFPDAPNPIRAVCEAWYDEVGAKSRTVRILLTRFRPTASGYRPATEAEYRRQEVPYVHS